MEIGATDYHTAGEPFRIVEAAGFDIPGVTVRARREYAASSEELDRVRRVVRTAP